MLLVLESIFSSAPILHTDEDYATLVCGEDRFGHFKEEMTPKATMSSRAVAFHERVSELQGTTYLANTNRAGITGFVETNVGAD